MPPPAAGTGFSWRRVDVANGACGMRERETFTAALWALNRGLAAFSIDGTFKSMSFQTPSEVLIHNSIALQ